MNIVLPTLKPLIKRVAAVKSEVIILDTEHGILAAKEQNLAAWVEDESLKDSEKVVYFFPSRKFTTSVNRMSGILSVQKTDKGYSLVSNKTRIDLEEAKTAWRYEPADALQICLNTAILQELIKFVQIAPDSKQTGLTYSGMVSLVGTEDPLGGSIEAIATDGKRIASLSIPADVQQSFSVLLPSSLIPIIPTLSDEKTLLFDDSRVSIIKSGKFTARANKFTDKFPDAKRLFPTGCDFIARVDAGEFREALGRLEAVMNEETRAVKLTWAQNLELRTGNQSTHGKDEIAYQTLRGRGNELAFTAIFDWKFLNDFFERVEGQVTCSYSVGKNFIVLQSKEKKYLLARMEK